MSNDAQTLMERARISEAICRWTACLDLRDWDGFGRQFTDPVEIAVANADWASEVPPRSLTRAQWTESVRDSLRHYSRFQHMATIYKIEINGDAAYTETYVMAPHIVPVKDKNLMLNMGGFYQESLIKVGGDWKINKHKLNLLWTHGDPEALALIAQENRSAALK